MHLLQSIHMHSNMWIIYKSAKKWQVCKPNAVAVNPLRTVVTYMRQYKYSCENPPTHICVNQLLSFTSGLLRNVTAELQNDRFYRINNPLRAYRLPSICCCLRKW